MKSCSGCSIEVSDPAEQWPDGANGILCQDCWETESDTMWWIIAQAYDQADLLESSGTAAWEALP